MQIAYLSAFFLQFEAQTVLRPHPVLVQVHERDLYGHLGGVFTGMGPAGGPVQALKTFFLLDCRVVAKGRPLLVKSTRLRKTAEESNIACLWTGSEPPGL